MDLLKKTQQANIKGKNFNTLIKIGSININGLNNKLNLIHNMIIDNNLNILCVQETHAIDLTKLEKWASLLNYKVYIHQFYNLPQMKFSKEGTITIITKKYNEIF